MSCEVNMSCRLCGRPLGIVFADLGLSPLANSYKKASSLKKAEKFYPLTVYVCSDCFLVQLPQQETPQEIFSEYAYFSSVSSSWLEHCSLYVDTIVGRLNLSGLSKVIELASNDGYLLKSFVKKGIPVLGVEPARNVARAAIDKGVPTLVEFFSAETALRMAERGDTADLLIGNNVLAHVPDIGDFVKGMRTVLRPNGVITMEFPHLSNLIKYNQFDTIYHEHFSYLSLTVTQKVFRMHNLKIFDVAKLPTHGGSLRIYAAHEGNELIRTEETVDALLAEEIDFGTQDISMYLAYAKKIEQTKRNILAFLIEAKNKGRKIAAYGAPAKGNTLLNYCGVGVDFISFTVDKNPYKQGCFLPGISIEIRHPNALCEYRPDYLIILPWNLRDEIMNQCSFIRDWGGRFVTLIPEVEIL